MQITRKSVCRQIQNSTLFCHSLAVVLDVLRARARCLQILDIFDFPRAPHLIRVPKEGVALKLPISQRVWATPTLNPSNYAKNMPTSRKFQKQLRGLQFGGSARRKPAMFFKMSLACPAGIICTTSQYSRMSRNALKAG